MMGQMRAEKTALVVSAAWSVLVVVRLPANLGLSAGLNDLDVPSVQDLLSKVGGVSRWWIISSLAVATVLGCSFYFVGRLRKNLKQIAEELAELRKSHSATAASQSESNTILKRDLSQVSGDLEKLSERIEGLDHLDTWLRSTISGMDQKLKDLKDESSNPKGTDFWEPPDKAVIDEILPAAEVIKPPGQISIGEMLEWVKAAGLLLKPVKATLGLFGNLSPSDDGDNWLAEDGQKNGESFVFPRPERFETAAHYEMYRSYYDCVQPAAGKIVIESPAIVVTDSEQGGWRLSTKGELSVIPS